MGTAFLVLLVAIGLLMLERLLIARSINRIPIRILVSGTRGKTAVCGLIAHGFRASGRTCVAKTTGTIPTLILPDGSETVISRRGPARIQEQFTVLRRAARMQTDVLVLESMSVTPDLLRIEQRFLSPTIFVLTNVRTDHLEQVPGAAASQIRAMTSGIPANAIVVTGEHLHLDELRAVAKRKQWDLRIVDTGGLKSDSVGNVNSTIAREVCLLAGCDSVRSEESLSSSARSIKPRAFHVRIGPNEHYFINAFDANDIESTRILLNEYTRHTEPYGDPLFILNTRTDRPLRSLEFARWLRSDHPRSRVIVVGTHRNRTRRELVRRGGNGSSITSLSASEVLSLPDLLGRTLTEPCVCVGIGNSAGQGETIVNAFQRYATSKASSDDH